MLPGGTKQVRKGYQPKIPNYTRCLEAVGRSGNLPDRDPCCVSSVAVVYRMARRGRRMLGWVVGLGAVGWLVVNHWEWLGAANGIESNSTTVRNIGLLIGAFVAFVLTLRRIRVAARQAHASEKSLFTQGDALRESQRALSYNIDKDRQALLNDQFYKATEMLTGAGVARRMFGIYGLQDLVERDGEQFGGKTLRLLCAFVRFPPLDSTLEQDVVDVEPVRPDVQVAMKVIAGIRDHPTTAGRGSRRMRSRLPEDCMIEECDIDDLKCLATR